MWKVNEKRLFMYLLCPVLTPPSFFFFKFIFILLYIWEFLGIAVCPIWNKSQYQGPGFFPSVWYMMFLALLKYLALSANNIFLTSNLIQLLNIRGWRGEEEHCQCLLWTDWCCCPRIMKCFGARVVCFVFFFVFFPQSTQARSLGF